MSDELTPTVGMTEEGDAAILCPVCKDVLARQGSSWVCDCGHSFLDKSSERRGLYIKALDLLERVVLVHRTVFEAEELGDPNWHFSCAETWALLDSAMVQVMILNGK